MITIQRTQTAFTCFALLAAISLAVGCKAPWSKDWKPSDIFSLDSAWPWGDDEDEPHAPTRLVGSWTDTVLHQAGKNPQRGFGGRLIFYGKESNNPILVDGQLVVYAFDETSREPTDNKPTRRYVFPSEQVARHMSKTGLGPSYSFWLPWDEEGGRQTEISLVARFEPKDGPVVVGEQTRHLLPGKLNAQAVAANGQAPKLPEGVPARPALPQPASAAGTNADVNSQVQQASYENATAAPPRRMSTTSISLPENFGRRGGATATPSAAIPLQSTAAAATSASGAAPPSPAPKGRTFNVNVPPAYQRPPLQVEFKPMPQSPFAGQAIYGAPPQMQPQPSIVPPQTSPQPQQNFTKSWPSQATQQMPPQMSAPQIPTGASESQWTTTVSYSPVEEAAGQAGQAGSAPGPSFGSRPPQPLVPSTPGVR